MRGRRARVAVAPLYTIGANQFLLARFLADHRRDKQLGDLRSEIFLFHAVRMRRMNHFPQRLVSLGPLRLFRRLVKSPTDARIGHNSNGLFILYNDHGFIEVGFVRLIFANERAIRKVMRTIDRRGPPSRVARRASPSLAVSCAYSPVRAPRRITQ